MFVGKSYRFLKNYIEKEWRLNICSIISTEFQGQDKKLGFKVGAVYKESIVKLCEAQCRFINLY